MIALLLSPVGLRLCAALVGLGLIGGTDAYISIHEYNKGWSAAIAAVAAKDKGALDAVAQATSQVDSCYRSGGVWSTVDGLCASK